MSARKEEWWDIPGYDGWYQISTEGRVRSFRVDGRRRQKGAGKAEHPTLLKPKLKAGNTSKGKSLIVSLRDREGKEHKEYMTKLMADTWMGGRRPGYLTCTKNGNPADVRLFNLEFKRAGDVARKNLSKVKTGPHRKRPYCKKLPVIKIDRTLAVVDAYPSASQAALASGVSKRTILDYCNRTPKMTIFAPDGYIYAWDDSRSIWATLKRVMKELDELGIRYNNPFTGRYFDIPQVPDLDLDPDIVWSEAPACGGGYPFGINLIVIGA